MTRAGESWFEQAFGAHYPLLYQHRDVAEARRCLDLLERLAPLTTRAGQLVLDLGCGDGRHLALLKGRGRHAVGLDLSFELLDRARAAAGPDETAELVRGDMRNLPFASGSFASVLSLFTAFGYFGSPAANRDPVREVGRVLEPGGHWFLDYFDCDRVVAELGDGEVRQRERELGPLTVRESRRYDAGKAQVSKLVRLVPRSGLAAEAARLGVPAAGFEYTEKVAVFTLAQLDDMAAGENMIRTASAGGYAAEPLGAGDRWILVFRKNSKDGRA